MHNTEPAPIVILAIEIIGDISELCTQMEILNQHVAEEDHQAHDEVPVFVTGESAR